MSFSPATLAASDVGIPGGVGASELFPSAELFGLLARGGDLDRRSKRDFFAGTVWSKRERLGLSSSAIVARIEANQQAVVVGN